MTDQPKFATTPSPYAYVPAKTTNPRIAGIQAGTLVDLDIDSGAQHHPGMSDSYMEDCAQDESALQAFGTGRHLLKDIYQAKGRLNRAIRASTVETIIGKSANGQNLYRREIPIAVRSEIAAAAASSFQSVSAKNDRALDTITGNLKALNNTIAGALRPTDKAAVQGLGAYCLQLKPEQRLPFLMGLVKSGSHREVSTALSESSYCFGIDSDQAASLKEAAEHKFAAPACRARSGALKMFKAVLDSSAEYVRHYQKTLPSVALSPREIAIQNLRGK